MSEGVVNVVGVGASAGGLEALRTLLAQGEPSFPAAIVIIQHLAPDHASMTAELLSRSTTLPVVRATEDVKVKEGTIYVIESNTALRLHGQTLLVSPRDDRARLHRPVDDFFSSLAEERGADACGVVLSGTGSDGTDGARAIKEAGGFVVAQSPDTARFDGMPRSLISSRCHDLILPPEEILPRLHSIAAHRPELAQHSPVLDRVLKVLVEQEDVDLTSYRQETVRRRVLRRVALSQIKTVEDYVTMLAENAQERDALIADVFIGVTRFFRDPEAFDALKSVIEKEAPRKDTFRAWICGCSSGEEAYSIAMLLWDQFDHAGGRDFKVFATDVSDKAIRQASRGVFSEEAMRNVPPELSSKFFEKTNDGAYQCIEKLRRRVVFSCHNALRDAPFSKLDLVVCRNMLIYLQGSAQTQLLERFSFSLQEGGILWLGPSEAPAEKMPEFEALDAKWRIYRNVLRRSAAGLRMVAPLRPAQAQHRPRSLPEGPSSVSLDWQKLHDEISEGYLPSHFIVGKDWRLLFQHGELSRSLLHFPEGAITTDLRALLPDQVRPAIEEIVSEAQEHGEAVIDGLKLLEGEPPIHWRGRALTNGLTALFVTPGSAVPTTVRQARELSLSDIETGLQRRVEQLEYELQLSKETLQNTVEELESSNEELQATNEELLASNEELQSVNEELQSVNEELHTVNAEYQQKLVQLSELNRDHDSLLATVDHGVLFLDGDLCVRRFNPKMQDYIALVDGDVGRPFSHFTHKLGAFPLLDQCAKCLHEHQAYEQVIITPEATILLARFTPLADKDDSQGLVLSLTDVTTLEKLRKSHTAFLTALDNVDLPLALLSVTGSVEYANQSLADLAGRDARYLVGTSAEDLVSPEYAVTWKEAFSGAAAGRGWEGYLQVARSDGQEAAEVVRLTPSMSPDGRVTGIVRVSLVSVRPGGAVSGKHTPPFFFSQQPSQQGLLGGVQLVVRQLCEGGTTREKALALVVPKDQKAVSDLFAEADRAIRRGARGDHIGYLQFGLILGASNSCTVTIAVSCKDANILGEVQVVEWKRSEQ